MKKNATADDFYEKYHATFVTVGAKYARLRAMLEAGLRDFFWGDDARLPTEHELARVTGMSLGTIQRALRELVNEGRLVRMPGRGTYVSKAKYHLGEPFVNARFLGDDGTSILPIDASFVARQMVSEAGPWTRALRTAKAQVLRIDRLYDVNGEFCMLNRFYVDPSRFSKFAALGPKEFGSTSLRKLLARMYRFPTVMHRQTVCFAQFTPAICSIVQVKRGTVGLLQSVTASIPEDDPVYFIELFIPPNGRQLQLPDAVLPR